MNLDNYRFHWRGRMVKITYDAAHISLLCDFCITKKKPVASGTTVSFPHNRDVYVDAYIPSGVFKSPRIDPKYVPEIVQAVSNDLKTCDDKWEALIRLHKGNKAPETLFYRVLEDASYRLYAGNYKPFGVMLHISQKLNELGQDGLADIEQMSLNFGKADGETPHVRGNSLRETVERAIAVFEQHDRIMSIDLATLYK